MDEMLGLLFAAAVRFSGLPALEVPPPVQAMAYPSMLLAVCADLKAEIPALRKRYDQCARAHRMQPSACDEIRSEMGHYDRCTRQHGLVAAYLIEERKIVYRAELNLEDDTDNSFIVHEYVHALQSQHYGDQMFATCEGVRAAEQEAYDAQQKYLQSRGQLLRVGERLRFVSCRDML